MSISPPDPMQAAVYAPSLAAVNPSATNAAAAAPANGSDTGTVSAADQPVVDKVTISAAGRAALQEMHETSAQTAREAMHGDRQAIKLEAKLAARQAEQQGG